WAHAVHQRVDQRPRREILPRAALGIFRVPFQQALVRVTLDVRRHLQPRLITNQVDDELAELGGVLNLVLGLAEDETQHSALLTELPQRVAIVLLQLDAFHLRVGEVDPAKTSRDGLRLAGEGRAFISHLQEQQERQLFKKVADEGAADRKSTRLHSSQRTTSYAAVGLEKQKESRLPPI